MLTEIDKRIYGTSSTVLDEREHLSELILATAELIRAANEVQVKPTLGACGTGGLYYGSTLATVREGNPERVVPMAELEKLLQRHFGSEVSIKVGETEVGRAVVKAINEVQRKAGKTLLNV